MVSFKEKLENLLKKEQNFLDENGVIDYIKIKDLADNIDAKLIEILISDNEIKNKFFSKIKDIYVFNINNFKFFLDENKIDNSYTQYKNRIGLFSGKEFVLDQDKIVLNFPFKDCVLEGGQNTEEGMDTYFEYDKNITKAQEKQGLKAETYNKKRIKRKEIFFNQILAHDEIDRLYDKKVFVNWKRFTKDSKKDGEAVKEIKRTENNLIQENLIIKGNNLFALHSLKSEFYGKIKLIYIDPPYNTENDSFVYNDSFTNSTWLSFMKNRLEVAGELLSDTGLMFISCDDREQAYLKVLLNEMFGRENTETLIWHKVGDDSGRLKVTHRFRREHEYIHVVYKDKKKTFFNKFEAERDYKNTYTNPDNDPRGAYKQGIISQTEESSTENGKNFYTVITPSGRKITRQWRVDKVEFQKLNKDNRIYYGKNGDSIPSLKVFINETKMATPISILQEYGTAKSAGIKLKELFDGEKVFDYPKPPELIMHLLAIATNENDIILDFFAGSGTTAQALLELNEISGIKRRFILIEQMNYIKDVTCERVLRVIKQEKIKESFIYCELAKWNEQAKEEIQKAKDLPDLVKLFNILYEKYFLNYNVKIRDFKEKIIKEENFKKLTLAQQKNMFLDMLDLNQMYVNESEMLDKKYKISAEDQKLTNSFYKKK